MNHSSAAHLLYATERSGVAADDAGYRGVHIIFCSKVSLLSELFAQGVLLVDADRPLRWLGIDALQRLWFAALHRKLALFIENTGQAADGPHAYWHGWARQGSDR